VCCHLDHAAGRIHNQCSRPTLNPDGGVLSPAPTDVYGNIPFAEMHRLGGTVRPGEGFRR
jgi:hypothetical protein